MGTIPDLNGGAMLKNLFFDMLCARDERQFHDFIFNGNMGYEEINLALSFQAFYEIILALSLCHYSNKCRNCQYLYCNNVCH